jgi:hypothetical protein
MQITTYEDALEVLAFFEFAAPALTKALAQDRRARAAILSKQASTQNEIYQLRKRMVDITPDVNDVTNAANQPDAVAVAIAAKRLEQVNEPVAPVEEVVEEVEVPVNVAVQAEEKDVKPEEVIEEEVAQEPKEEVTPEPAPTPEVEKTSTEKARRDGSDGKQPFTPFKISTTTSKTNK